MDRPPLPFGMFARPTGGVKSGGVDNRDGDTAPNRPRVRNGNEVPSSVIPAEAGIQVGWAGKQCRSAQPPTPGFPLSRPCQNCPLSLWERVGVRATPTAQAAIDPLSLWERVGVREPPHPRPRPVDPLSQRERVEGTGLGKQAGVNGSGRVIGGPHPAFGHPLPEGEGLDLRDGHPLPEGEGFEGFGTGRTGLRPPSPRGRGVGFGTGRTGLRPPSPRGRGVGFGTGRTGLRPPSPRGRGVGFGTGRTGLRPPSPRGRGALTQPVSRE